MNRFIPDPFIFALLATVTFASLFPATGEISGYVNTLATAAVILLFFLHGVKLPRENLLAALTNWKLHLLILGTTYVVFPLLGLGLSQVFPALLPANLWAGVLFLCALPSTVQSSIACTSMAQGNVGASVTSAAASNLLGIVLTPLIVGVLLQAQGSSQIGLSGVWKIVLQLLLPFVVGHLLRPQLGAWAARRKALITGSDRLTIILSVYSAFSAAVIAGIWSQLPLSTLLILAVICCGLFGTALLFTLHGARAAGLPEPDARSALYCGSFKSIVSGVPMARVLFPAAEIGALILPIIVFHQIQLMIGATVAQRQGRRQP